MTIPRETQYSFNPHKHVKVWFSTKPNLFMNIENQMRLIALRDKNPNDEIHLAYDSSLLNDSALKELHQFCSTHNIKKLDLCDTDSRLKREGEFKQHPDVCYVASELKTERERTLYQFYRDEITNLKQGGNPATASDIVRWLEAVYSRGTYTDFDVPVDTRELPESIPVHAPLLLNIGSLKMLGKEMIYSNNDFIAVVDANAAKPKIEQTQDALIEKLTAYSSDFIEKTTAAFPLEGVFAKLIIKMMQSRSEPLYIVKANNLFGGKKKSSLETRKYIYEVMTNKAAYLDFKKERSDETPAEVIKRLRAELKKQLGFLKWLLFRKEYREIKTLLASTDDQLIQYLMKKERTLYLEVIVMCTTGPVSVAKALFGNYVFGIKEFANVVQNYSFKSYQLNRYFISKNSMRLHEDLFGMMKFISADEGELNDGSWLETGAALQGSREERLMRYKETLRGSLPYTLSFLQGKIEQHLRKIQKQQSTPEREAKIKALNSLLDCFSSGLFDVQKFRTALEAAKRDKKNVFASASKSSVKEFFDLLDKISHEATVFSLTKDKKIPVHKTTQTTRSTFPAPFGMKANARVASKVENKQGKPKIAAQFFKPLETDANEAEPHHETKRPSTHQK